MTMRATLDADTRTTIEESIMELDGILHAAMDTRSGDIWVVRDPAHDAGPIEFAVRNRLASLGHDPANFVVRTTLPVPPGPRRRVRFVSAERAEDYGKVAITVTLEWNGKHHTGTASGDKGHALELKTTALAALEALRTLTPHDLQLRVIGVKPIHAFDSDLIVVSLLRTEGAHQRLVGAVVAGDDILAASALAVLSAVNRTLGNFLDNAD